MPAPDADDDHRSTPTPWGPAEGLRDRRLPPGPATPAPAVAREQRERLFAATVAVVAERGYEATRVADILEVAGVSRGAFYKHFADKGHCFVATLAQVLDLGRAAVADAYRAHDGRWDERLGAALDAAIELIVAQPAAARICFVEAYAAGPEAVELAESVADGTVRVAARALRESPERAGMPPDLARAVLGGIRRVIEARLRRGRERELPGLAPDLLAWALAYRPPPEPLRRPPRPPDVPPEPSREGATAADDQRARIVAAVAAIAAEKGYAALTIGEVADRGAVSLSTFYAHYSGKQEVFAAAIEDGDRRLVATAVAAHRRAGGGPHTVGQAIRALLAFLEANPAIAWLAGHDACGGGAAAIERHEQALAPLQQLLAGGRARRSRAERLTAEATAGSLWALVYERLRSAGPARLYDLAPPATFLALSPPLGPHDACAIANHRG